MPALTTPRNCHLHIGWFSISITPDQPVQLAGQFHERVSESVHDQCRATVLAIDAVDADGESVDQMVQVSANLASISASYLNQVRAAVAAQVPEFDVEKISINATHTHTAPCSMSGRYPEKDRAGVMLPPAYLAFLCERTTEAVVEAWKNRQPGSISSALGHAVLGWPRRAIYTDGTAKMYGSSNREDFRGMEGPSDPGMEILLTWDQAGELTGIAAAVACPAQVVENLTVVSADFWHPATERLKAHFGQHVHVLGLIAAAGDQSPRDLIRRNRVEPNMRSLEGMNELGRRLANGVIDAFEHHQSDRSSRVAFAHIVETVDLPLQQVSAAQYQQAKDVLAGMAGTQPKPGSSEAAVHRRQNTVIQRYETQTGNELFTIELHVIRLGDIVLATNPFELFLSYGMQIRARSMAELTFVIQLANGKGQYLPTAEAVTHGGYSAMIHETKVGPVGGQILVEHTVNRINSLFEQAVEAAAAR